MHNEILQKLHSDGFCVVPGAFPIEEISSFRSTAAKNLDYFGKTRSNANAYHLAGFHRFPQFEAIHAAVSGNEVVRQILDQIYNFKPYISIGISDITVNRSQPWHTDLLRGQYRHYLNPESCWGQEGGGCIKVLVYLQDGSSLRVVPGSHRIPSPLSDPELQEIAERSEQSSVAVKAGDIVLLDIRAIHRGSSDDDMLDPRFVSEPKILISTVFAGIRMRLAREMQIGNMHRLIDWDAKFLLNGT